MPIKSVLSKKTLCIRHPGHSYLLLDMPDVRLKDSPVILIKKSDIFTPSTSKCDRPQENQR